MTTLTYSLLALGVCAVVFYWLRSLIVLFLCLMVAALGLVLVPEASLLKQVVVEKLLQFGGPGLPASTRNWLAQRLPPAEEPGLTIPDEALTRAGMARNGMDGGNNGVSGMNAMRSPPPARQLPAQGQGIQGTQGGQGVPGNKPGTTTAGSNRSANGTGIRYMEDENRARSVLNGTPPPAPRVATSNTTGNARTPRPLPEGFDSEAPATGDTAATATPPAGKIPATKTEKPAEKATGVQDKPQAKQAWIVQLGVFSDAQNAEKLRAEVGDSLGGNVPVHSQTLHTDKGEQVRVLAGPFPSRTEANKVQGMLKAMQINAVVKARS